MLTRPGEPLDNMLGVPILHSMLEIDKPFWVVDVGSLVNGDAETFPKGFQMLNTDAQEGHNVIMFIERVLLS